MKTKLPSILRGTKAEVFKKILLKHMPPPALILDATCGYKHFWDELWYAVNTITLAGEEAYTVIFNDIRPLGHIVSDYRKLPFKENTFDCIVFDPPYTKMHEEVTGYKKWLKGDRFGLNNVDDFTDSDFQEFAKQAYLVTKSKGIVIVKIQDTGDLWHFKAPKLMQPFKLKTYYIHDFQTNWRLYRRASSEDEGAVQVHSFFMVFSK